MTAIKEGIDLFVTIVELVTIGELEERRSKYTEAEAASIAEDDVRETLNSSLPEAHEECLSLFLVEMKRAAWVWAIGRRFPA